MESNPRPLTKGLTTSKNENEVLEKTSTTNGVSKVFNQETLDLLENVWGNLLIDYRGEERGRDSRGKVEAT